MNQAVNAPSVNVGIVHGIVLFYDIQYFQCFYIGKRASGQASGASQVGNRPSVGGDGIMDAGRLRFQA